MLQKKFRTILILSFVETTGACLQVPVLSETAQKSYLYRGQRKLD